ncbi:MAG TPA: tyrosine recombinase XerC [Bacteroidales bacterium]|nr:tyrosine recombinase XerC [Bacteroidales bacterium]HSA43848.1 tyrosine recombinase XerC [Bacteroidales bacterium]
MNTTERFLQYIRFEKRYSPHTVLAYQKDLAQFQQYIDQCYPECEISQADHQMIRSWLVGMMNKKLTARSVNRKLTALKSFYRFLLKEQLISINPMVKVVAPRIPRRLPEFVPEDQLSEILSANIETEDYGLFRDRMIVEVFYSTGIRRIELINLKDTDVSFYTHSIKVLGKRNKERLIPIGGHLESLLQTYMDRKQKEFELVTQAETWLFLSKKGRKLNPRSVYKIVNEYLDKLSHMEKRSPHVLRHSFATHMLNRGADLNAIKELLGHANLSATQVYTHNTIEKLKKVYEQAHPRA